jgi:hypothetical protein
VPKKMMPLVQRAGVRVGMVFASLGVLYLLLIALMMFSGSGFPPEEPFQSMFNLLILAIAICMVVFWTIPHVSAPPEKRLYSLYSTIYRRVPVGEGLVRRSDEDEAKVDQLHIAANICFGALGVPGGQAASFSGRGALSKRGVPHEIRDNPNSGKVQLLSDQDENGIHLDRHVCPPFKRGH